MKSLVYLKYLHWLALFFSMASNEPMPRYFFNRTPSAKKYSPGASVVPANMDPSITEHRDTYTQRLQDVT